MPPCAWQYDSNGLKCTGETSHCS